VRRPAFAAVLRAGPADRLGSSPPGAGNTTHCAAVGRRILHLPQRLRCFFRRARGPCGVTPRILICFLGATRCPIGVTLRDGRIISVLRIVRSILVLFESFRRPADRNRRSYYKFRRVDRSTYALTEHSAIGTGECRF
jgi:hypothetical protein